MNSDKEPQEPAGKKFENENEKEQRLAKERFIVSMGLIRVVTGQY